MHLLCLTYSGLYLLLYGNSPWRPGDNSARISLVTPSRDIENRAMTRGKEELAHRNVPESWNPNPLPPCLRLVVLPLSWHRSQTDSETVIVFDPSIGESSLSRDPRHAIGLSSVALFKVLLTQYSGRQSLNCRTVEGMNRCTPESGNATQCSHGASSCVAARFRCTETSEGTR